MLLIFLKLIIFFIIILFIWKNSLLKTIEKLNEWSYSIISNLKSCVIYLIFKVNSYYFFIICMQFINLEIF